jgi:hypothetical protein
MHNDEFSIFVSYSDENIEEAQKFVRALKEYFPWNNVFLARNDLPKGEDYEENLIKAIKQCVVFIPLISKKFLCSPYANQEIGFAKSLNKIIYPAQLDETSPPGFIHLLNADDGTDVKVIKGGHMESFVINLIKKMEVTTRNIILQSLHIGSFYQTDVLLKILEKRDDFTHRDMQILKMAYESNDQINSCSSGEGIAKIIQEYEESIEHEL